MKTNLNLLLFISIFLSLNSLFGQGSNQKLVFMIDPRIDLVKLGSNGQGRAVSIASSPKFPNGLACREYKFNNALNNIELLPGFKLGALPVDPSKAIFFLREVNGDNGRIEPIIVTYVAGNPGVFMGPDGEEIKLPKSSTDRNFFGADFAKKSETGNKSVTNENTIANLKNKDRTKGFIGEVAVPTTQPKLKIFCSFDKTQPKFGIVRYRVLFPDESNAIISLQHSGNSNTGAGDILSKAKLIGDKLIELSKQCVGENQASYCKQPSSPFGDEAVSLLDELRKIPGFENLGDNTQTSDLQLMAGLATIK